MVGGRGVGRKRGKVQSGYISTQDGTIHYRKTGAGKPLIFLHSLGQASNIWEDVAVYFARNYTVFAIDIVGHGDSDKPVKDYTIPNYAGSVVNFMTALDIGSASIIGNSIGATIALETTHRYPERVEKLVLVGCPGWDTDAEKNDRLAFTRSQLDANGNPKMYTLDEIRSLYRKASAPLLGKLNSNRAKAGKQFLKAMQALCAYDLTTVLSSISCPTMVLYGRNDLLMEKAYVLTRGIKGSRLAVMNDAYHLPQVDDPQAFSEIVTSFLAEV